MENYIRFESYRYQRSLEASSKKLNKRISYTNNRRIIKTLFCRNWSLMFPDLFNEFDSTWWWRSRGSLPLTFREVLAIENTHAHKHARPDTNYPTFDECWSSSTHIVNCLRWDDFFHTIFRGKLKIEMLLMFRNRESLSIEMPCNL